MRERERPASSSKLAAFCISPRRHLNSQMPIENSWSRSAAQIPRYTKMFRIVPRKMRSVGLKAHLKCSSNCARSCGIIRSMSSNLSANFFCPTMAATRSITPAFVQSKRMAARCRCTTQRSAHVDAFPSRPTHGGRILRVFTNIHPTRPRVWNVGETFPVLANKLAKDAGLDRFAAQGGTSTLGRIIHALGGPVPNRSAYDRFMLHFHDYLKENSQYQANCPKTRIEFPPMATWLVYTDGIPHAVMSGQHALEQTFIISRAALVSPEVSPISVLESLSGRQLARATA